MFKTHLHTFSSQRVAQCQAKAGGMCSKTYQLISTRHYPVKRTTSALETPVLSETRTSYRASSNLWREWSCRLAVPLASPTWQHLPTGTARIIYIYLPTTLNIKHWHCSAGDYNSCILTLFNIITRLNHLNKKGVDVESNLILL